MSARDSFRRMAGIYDKYRRTDPLVYETLSSEVEELLEKKRRLRVLDVGCGTGNLSTELAEEHRLSLTGIDVTAEMIQQAAAKHPQGTWILDDFETRVFDSEYDLILMSYVIHHLKRQREAVTKAAGLLSPGGRLAVVTDDHDQFTGSAMHQLVPRMIEIDTARFPSVATLQGWLGELGLRVHAHEAVRVERYATPEDVARRVERIRARYVSTLTLLTDEEVRVGAERFERYLLEALKAGPVEERRVKTILVAEKA